MPPSNKRKRPERQYSGEDSSNRPSPHRPQDLNLAQQNQRGGRGGSRRQSRQAPLNTAAAADSTSTQVNSTNTPPRLETPRRETPAVNESRAATPSQPVAPSQPPADEGPKAPPAPYFYEHVTDDRVNAWEDEGRSAIVEVVKQDDDLMETSTILQELIRSALDSRLNATDAGSVIKQAIADLPDTHVQTLFLHTLSLLDDADTRNSNLLSLVAATDIDPEVIRQSLDIPLLQALGLVRTSFAQMRTRKTTNILYRQANFNLLREESEGYAKLITEYFNTASRAVSNRDVSAEAAFERITALVGSFDLDVGRVLDITLDISANLLVRAYGFFVKFYRCSFWWPEEGVLDNVKWEGQGFGTFPKWALPEAERPRLDSDAEDERTKAEQQEMEVLKLQRDAEFWRRVADDNVGMDAFFELGARRIVGYDDVLPLLETEIPAEYDSRGKEINGDRRKRINENRKYMKETKLLPPPGNSDAAQLLGFKLRFYASDARDATDTLPENLIFLAALLIKIGFISLRDLYPHLYPADEKMPKERQRLSKEKAEKEAKERPGAGENALTMAKALTDDTLTPAQRKLMAEQERSGGTTPKPDKKDEEPKEELPTPTNQKLALLKALLLIGCLPEALYILGRFPWLMDVDTTLPPYLHRIALKMLSKIGETVRPSGLAEREMSTAKQELKESATDADGSLRFKQRDAKKVTKWLGLDKVDKESGNSYRHYYPDWDDNIPVCQDIEDVFTLCHSFLGLLGVKIGQSAQLLSTLIRIALASLRLDFSEPNKARWLDVMGRLIVPSLSLSKHNLGLNNEMFELLSLFPMITRYNIYAAWFIKDSKIARWPDMIDAFAVNTLEARQVLRQTTNENAKRHARGLAKVALSSPGNVIFDMIKMLQQFNNMVPALTECTRYFSPMAYDVLAWALIQMTAEPGMSRIQEDGMLTSAWLQALARFVALLFNRDSNVDPTPMLQYLASELRAGNTTDLEVFEQILAEMGGIRSDLEFNDAQILTMAGGEHLQTPTLEQLADKRYSPKSQAKRLVKALAEPNLVGQFLIAIAQNKQMYASDPSNKEKPLKVLGNNVDKIQAVFQQYLEVLKTNVKPQDFEGMVPDLLSLIKDFGLEPQAAFAIARIAILHHVREHNAISKPKRRKSSEAKAVEGEDAKLLTNGDSEHAVNGVAAATATDGTEAGSPPSQLTKPSESQEESPWHPVLQSTIDGLHEALPGLASKVSIPFYTTFWTMSLSDVYDTGYIYQKELDKITAQLDRLNKERADTSAAGIKDRDRRKKALLEQHDNLRKEYSNNVRRLITTKKRISDEKKHYFPDLEKNEEVDQMHLHLLEQCFLPRALNSQFDAQYAFTMLKMLHDFGTPGFNTVNLLMQLMHPNKLMAIIFQCTANEAVQLGRFLYEILKLLQTWHASKATYEKEAHGASKQLPGFQKSKSKEFIDYEDFRQLVFKWHQNLTTALHWCFESKEYMHIRNGISVLRAAVQVYPVVVFMGEKLAADVLALSENEERQDLKLAAMSLRGPLEGGKKQWVNVQLFKLAVPQSGKAATPQAEGEGSNLNAKAEEFKPALPNGSARKESVAGPEDGEIEDEKKSGDEVMKDAPAVKTDAEASKKNDDAEVKAKSQESEKVVNKEEEKAASKPSTPAPTMPSKPPPADTSRPPSSQQPSSSRSGHNLPNRPDSRPPNRPLPTPPNERQGGRYPGRGDDKYGRLDRPNDLRPASRDHSPGGRARARSRSPERDPYYSSFAAARGGPPRDDRGPPPRQAGPTDSRYRDREDPYASSRRDHPPQQSPHSRPAYDPRDRTNGAMGPPPSQPTREDRSNYPGAVPQQNSRAVASSTQAPSTPQNQDSANVNPARRALIENENAGGRGRGGDLIGPPKDSRRERETRDDRPPPEPRTANEPPRDPQSRTAPPADLAPTGPRRSRTGRDLNAQGGESTFGRLNGPPADVPSGPRPPPNGPATRGARGFQPAQVPAASRPNESPGPSPTTARPPESPAALRGPTSRATHDRRGSGQPSAPTTPATENGPAVHPSRLANVAAQPPPIQTNVTANGPGSAASPTSAAPSGPRGPGRAPAGPAAGPPAAGPPSGPASAAERQRRGDRQRADINATLQGNNGATPNGQGVSFRGAAQNRAPNAPPATAANAPPVQAVASSMEPPARRNEPPAGRQEPPVNRPASRGGDLFQGKQDRGQDRGEEGRRRDDGRQDRARGSRNTSRERRGEDEAAQRPPPPPPPPNDRRDRRGGARDDRGREGYDVPPVRGGERPFRPDEGPPRRPPPPESSGSYQGPPPDYDRRGPRRDGPDDSRRGGRGSGRGEDFRGPPPRREEERREGGRPRDDGPPPQAAGRKRRHEDGPPPTFDETKRRRSGR